MQQQKPYNKPQFDESLKSIVKPTTSSNSQTKIGWNDERLDYSEFSDLPLPETFTPCTYGAINEQKGSTSIANIGNAVLRSKTANFERMLIQNKKQQSGASTDKNRSGRNRSGGNVLSPKITPTGDEHKNVVDNDADFKNVTSNLSNSDNNISKRSGHIYKRQQIISSVRLSKK